MYFQIALLGGVIPPLLISYWTMGNFEGLFDDKKFFFYLVIGFMIGIVLSLFFIILSYSTSSYLDMSIIFVIFFALLMELTKFVILARKKIKKDFRLVFYGSALGLGIAGTFIAGLSYRYYLVHDIFGFEEVLSFILMAFSLSYTQFMCGFFVAKGIATKEITRYMGYSFVLQALYNICLLPYIWNFHPYITAIITAPFIFLLFIIPDKIKKTLPKEARKKLRRKNE